MVAVVSSREPDAYGVLMERRYHNPYRHWFAGLVFEVAVFLGFVAVAILVALASAWVFG